MKDDAAYLLMMKLSRCWGIPYCELVERIDEEELWRQKAFDELIPMEDGWMQTCWLIESMESLVRKKVTPASKRYPGDLYKEFKKPVVSRSRQMQQVAAILNRRQGGR